MSSKCPLIFVLVLTLLHVLAAPHDAGAQTVDPIFGKVVHVYPGDSYPTDVFGGGYRAFNGDVFRNTLNIFGGSVGGAAFGGYSFSGSVYNNTLNMYGGYAYANFGGGILHRGMLTSIPSICTEDFRNRIMEQVLCRVTYTTILSICTGVLRI